MTTYLNKCSEHVKREHSNGKSPGCAKSSKSIKLSKHHDIHKEATDDHECIFHLDILCKIGVKTFCHIKHSIFYTSNFLIL